MKRIMSNDPATPICANEQRTYTNEGSVFKLRNVVAEPIAIQDTTSREKAQNGRGWSEDGTSYTLDAAATQGVAIAFANRTRDGVKVPEVMPDGITPALTNPGNGGRADAINVVAPTLTSANDPSRSPQSSEITQQVTAVHGACMAVRRLTPRECERLQGFQDDHTLIPWRGKPAAECPDGPRYKALGNSMAVPCMAWIGRRIAAQEMLPLRYLSVCSGIEAASVAWEPLGWQPAAFAEVEKFPSAVLAHHWPHVPNLGDMTKYEEWKLGTIDLLAGGTPCQSFSVAGLRQGLRDPRGGLMLTYLEIAQRHRPRWLVWENVPGVLSSHGGRDFGAFLGALGALGYGWAYRVLDAQWFGVAQRRRRVFVVGCAGDGAAAATVLFESESVCRNPAPSREKGQGVAADAAGGAGGGRRGGYDAMSLAGTLGRRGVRSHTELDGHGAYIPQTVGTLSDGAHNGGGLMAKMPIVEEYSPQPNCLLDKL
jgi:site-specific DNA-cytosine methylase